MEDNQWRRSDVAMKYVCLVYLEESKLHAVPDRECMASGDRFRTEGLLVAAEALQPVRKARSVRVRGGQMMVTDGPFAETKEMLAGFYLIEAADDDEAVRIAARIPPAREGTIEVRPVRELEP
jgi:hypothetical protein